MVGKLRAKMFKQGNIYTMMKSDNSRRAFLKTGSLAAGISLVSPFDFWRNTDAEMDRIMIDDLNMIGAYGSWAANIVGDNTPMFSFRNDHYTNVRSWQSLAKQMTMDRIASPQINGVPEVTLEDSYEYDGLAVEEISWQLPYGPVTKAILLKPANASGPLPGIVALHDHGGNKYFGRRKITRTSDDQHPLMSEHQEHYYEGRAWANEVAKRGYVVLVPDAFTFASRRVLLEDVPERIRQGLTDNDPENPENIEAYNRWAGGHEHIMAKSLFCAGTTWPGVFFAEDQKALDILASRNDVQSDNLGCAGLSGGGLRTVFLGGLDERIKCSVCVGFMSTWRDFLLHKSFTHTWMAYVPLLPRELDFPEIMSLNMPSSVLVLNDSDDQLYTLPEMERAEGILNSVYQKADLSDHFKCSYYPGPHKFDQAMQLEAFNWFDQWLK